MTMTDRERVIKGLMCCQYSSKSHCDECPYCYEGLCETNDCTADLASDALSLLKEQEDLGTELMNAVELIHKKNERIEKLLKEQESVKPVITPWAVNEDGEVEIAKRECGKCGWQFFTEKPNYCENCGTPILWESGEVG